MTLEEHMAKMARVMLDAGHHGTWWTCRWSSPEGQEGVAFAYLTVERSNAAAASAALGQAGLLCEVNLLPGKESDPGLVCLPAVVVQSCVSGLRALGSAA